MYAEIDPEVETAFFTFVEWAEWLIRLAVCCAAAAVLAYLVLKALHGGLNPGFPLG